jgi:hypothetical protein
VVIAGADASDQERLYVQAISGGVPTPVTGEGVTLGKVGRPVSPDGRRVAALGPDGIPAVYPLAGGEPTPLPGLADDDLPLCWTPDGRELMVVRYRENPPFIERVDVASGRTRPWAGPHRSLPAALWGQTRVLVTPDGRSYAYGYFRRMSDLYLSSPLR